MGKEEEMDGGFLLESLGDIDLSSVSDETKKLPAFGGKEKESRFFGKDRVIATDPNRELRELRERQQRFERRVFILTMMLLLSLTVLVVGTQTSLGPKAMVAMKNTLGLGKSSVSCQVPANYNHPDCAARRRDANSDWRGIERGSGSKFSLHGGG